jgi:hypothetical protein
MSGMVLGSEVLMLGYDKKRFPAISSGQLEVDFASDQVGDRDEIAQ